ncbi:TatD family hydrolase [Pseudoxanthomonas dokdonensis]|uniref:DNAase n=1 Tax=Pseudoxanthomonas dokdonensis TaxID=344882 RepID=A0A0R0CI35_9GAMM|nr:TatD family hydrolase [Pseudoxanthomonas dokdonensis]KRG68838.1 DNAase [Pseudoxanthomonas dokdonensis]
MQLIDSHCHLDASEFDPDRGEVIARARAAGVGQQIVPAINARGWPGLRDLCTAGAGLHPAYGLHPMFLADHRPSDLDDLKQWLRSGQAVAVGECGLDFYIEDLDRRQQHYYFDAQLRLAREFNLPVIVHARRAVEAVIVAIKRIGGLRGVVHSFAGSPEQARQLWDLGFMLGLGGPVSYPRAQRLRRLVADMPLEYLLLETDAPDQPDAGIRGQRNEPARLATIAATIAGLRGETVEHVAAVTTRNAMRLFALPVLPDAA